MKLSQIALKIDCRMTGEKDVEIVRVAGIEEAGPGDLAFLGRRVGNRGQDFFKAG